MNKLHEAIKEISSKQFLQKKLRLKRQNFDRVMNISIKILYIFYNNYFDKYLKLTKICKKP